MRQALVNENSDLVAENAKYVMRITGARAPGRAQLDYFIAGWQISRDRYDQTDNWRGLPYAGSSFLNLNINSMTEFKQIIGRVATQARLWQSISPLWISPTPADFGPEFDGTRLSIIDDDDRSRRRADHPIRRRPPAPTPGPCGDTDDPPEKESANTGCVVSVTILNRASPILRQGR